MGKFASKSKTIGTLLGAVLMAAAVISVFVIDWNVEVEHPPPPIRPVKTMEIGGSLTALDRKYPGRIRAIQEVRLAFNVSGPLIELLVKKGEDVEKGQLLARIDPRDYQNNVNAYQAKLDKAESDLEKIKQLTAAKAATARELIDAQAKYDIAVADLRIAEKALQDTYMYAPFTGMIADRYVENFENVLAKQAVLGVQDVSEVEILVDVPEERVILARRSKDLIRHTATFDYLPSQSFDVQIKEFAAEADPSTQTFLVTFVMDVPENINLLPGMTATITEHWKEDLVTDEVELGYKVPVDAVVIDGIGGYYVWKVKTAESNHFTVHRTDIKVAEMTGNEILIIEGLVTGDRIATAGVHFLAEGQKVRLFTSRGGGGS